MKFALFAKSAIFTKKCDFSENHENHENDIPKPMKTLGITAIFAPGREIIIFSDFFTFLKKKVEIS